MTATEELRRLLDERGVEYQFNEIIKVFEWHYEGTDGDGFAHATEVQGGINIIACSLTPEQAIAATLGPCNDSCSCTNGERTGERTGLASTLGAGTWSDFDMKMAYHMGYDDALAGRKPDAGKVVADG